MYKRKYYIAILAKYQNISNDSFTGETANHSGVASGHCVAIKIRIKRSGMAVLGLAKWFLVILQYLTPTDFILSDQVC